MINMIMPQMGESIIEGTIVKWRKRQGEIVQKDEMILEISTDKVDSEIPSPAFGILQEILAQEGQTVEVGTVIARITADAQGVTEIVAVPEKTEKVKFFETKPSTVYEQSKKFLSPLVKKMAKEHNISLSELEKLDGSGANGRISKRDLLAFLSPTEQGVTSLSLSQKPTPQTIPTKIQQTGSYSADQVDIIPMDHIRKRIAEHMVMSKRNAPHVTSVAEVDVTRIVKYRDKVKEQFEKREGAPLTYTVFFMHAAAQAIRDFPLINSSVDGDRIIQKKFINIGIAVGMDKGLIVPVVKNADRLSLVGLAQALYDLATRARNKQLQPDEVQGGTFSITNIGTFGNLFGTPIINQPQVAILGAGAIKKRPIVVEDDAIVIRSMMYISLTYDHRIIDGLLGGSFLQRIVQNLENFKLEF